MNLTLITCTGDRPEAFALCEKFMARQTTRWHQWIVLDDGEKPQTVTLAQECYYDASWRGRGSMVKKLAFALPKVTGDAIVFIEDDDWYNPLYLQWCINGLGRFPLIGEAMNVYYNVQQRWWFAHQNKFHASLCATALRRTAFPFLQSALDSEDPFVDSRLWQQCRLPKMPYDPTKAPNGIRMTIGMKSMPGRKGYGEGHGTHADRAILDGDMKHLRMLIGDDCELYADFFKREETKPVEPMTRRGDCPTVEVHIVCFNEELILPYTLRHYQTFAAKIIIHDGGSTDRSKEIAKEYGAEVRDWDTNGEINDTLLKRLKETAWIGTSADWVIMADADEFIYFPDHPANSLKQYEQQQLAFVKPRGFEMESPELPVNGGQIYEEIRHGAPDDKWYAKPVLFSPKRVKSIDYMVGAHECKAVLHSGLKMINPVRFSQPPCYLLHYHHIGSVERIGAKYDANRKRFSKENKEHNWGWNGDGLRHARDKRAYILARRQEVIRYG